MTNVQRFSRAVTGVILALAAAPATAQEWPYPGAASGAARSAPTLSGWAATVRPARSVSAPAVLSAWRTTVITVRIPLAVSNPIPRAAPRTVDPLTGASHALEGIASYYWQEQLTATGELFDRTAMTAAHRTLPLNSRVRVTNVVNGRSIVVRINDRGPFNPGRIIDLSQAAAAALDMHTLGLVPVKLQVISN